MRSYLPRLPSDPFLDRVVQEQLPSWEQAIRTACETLDADGASEIHAATVTLSHGIEGQVALLCGLVAELAAEYRLEASTRLDSGAFTTRLTRPQHPAAG
jgi:hypothetical protein